MAAAAAAVAAAAAAALLPSPVPPNAVVPTVPHLSPQVGGLPLGIVSSQSVGTTSVLYLCCCVLCVRAVCVQKLFQKSAKYLL